MFLYEVVETKTRARMSRSPKVGEFIGVDLKGRPKTSTPGDLMGTTLFDHAGLALDWLRDQGLSGTHEVRPARD